MGGSRAAVFKKRATALSRWLLVTIPGSLQASYRRKQAKAFSLFENDLDTEIKSPTKVGSHRRYVVSLTKVLAAEVRVCRYGMHYGRFTGKKISFHLFQRKLDVTASLYCLRSNQGR